MVFNKKWSKKLWVTYSILLLSFVSYSQTLVQAKAIADSAFTRAHFKLAAKTYERVAFFEGETVNFTTYYKLGLCQQALGNIPLALKSFDRAYFLAQTNAKKNEVNFAKIQLLLTQKDFNTALLELFGLIPVDSAQARRKNFLLSVGYFAQQKYEQAEVAFTEALGAQYASQLTPLLRDKRLTRPNPQTAKILSILIPGFGQMYAGDVEAGVNALLLASAIIGSGVYIAQLYTPIDAAVSIIPWYLRYYIGGYAKAEEIAIRKNQENRSEVLNDILLLFEN